MNYLEVGIMYDKQTPSFNNTRDDSTHGHHQMVNIEIRLIIFFPGIKIAERNINNLRYADDTTLMA